MKSEQGSVNQWSSSWQLAAAPAAAAAIGHVWSTRMLSNYAVSLGSMLVQVNC